MCLHTTSLLRTARPQLLIAEQHNVFFKCTSSLQPKMVSYHFVMAFFSKHAHERGNLWHLDRMLKILMWQHNVP